MNCVLNSCCISVGCVVSVSYRHILWSSICVGSIHVASSLWFPFSIQSLWFQFMLHHRWMCGFNFLSSHSVVIHLCGINSCCIFVVVSIFYSIPVVSIHVASPLDVWFQFSIVTFCGHPSVWDQNNRCLKCIHDN
eukprot:179418_1